MPGDTKEDALLKVGPIVLNRAAVILIASLALGTGGISGYSSISEPVPDRYTGAEGIADRKASIERDDHERQSREAEDTRLRAAVQGIRLQIAACQEYQHSHQVESAKGFGRIGQLEKETDKMQKEIDRLELAVSLHRFKPE